MREISSFIGAMPPFDEEKQLCDKLKHLALSRQRTGFTNFRTKS